MAKTGDVIYDGKLSEVKYYESHITIEPVFGKRLTSFRHMAAQFNFKVADLLMKKERTSTPERSDKDSFCTGRDKDLLALRDRMALLAEALRFNGFQVWRCKIEAVLIDERSAA